MRSEDDNVLVYVYLLLLNSTGPLLSSPSAVVSESDWLPMLTGDRAGWSSSENEGEGIRLRSVLLLKEPVGDWQDGLPVLLKSNCEVVHCSTSSATFAWAAESIIIAAVFLIKKNDKFK